MTDELISHVFSNGTYNILPIICINDEFLSLIVDFCCIQIIEYSKKEQKVSKCKNLKTQHKLNLFIRLYIRALH